MTTKDKALEFAIEMLEQMIACHDEPACPAIDCSREAIAACRTALVQNIEQEPVVVSIPSEALSLSGDAKLAHDQCRAVVQLANSFAEIYAARAAIVAHDARLADLIGEASASAMEWLGDELNAMDATSEEDVLLDPIFEAAQERWPQPPKRKPMTEEDIWRGVCAACDAQKVKSPTLAEFLQEEKRKFFLDFARFFEAHHGIGGEA